MTMFVRELRLVLMALQFLTRLPVPAWVGYEPSLMSRAVRHFPLVGALIGIVVYIGSRLFSPEEEQILAKIFGEKWTAYSEKVLLPWL